MKKISRTGLLTVTVLALTGCSRSVEVFMNGPVELAGAEVHVDGKRVATMERIDANAHTTKGPGQDVQGSMSRIVVSRGRHELRFEKSGIKPIIRQVEYKTTGEDYIGIQDYELVPAELTTVSPADVLKLIQDQGPRVVVSRMWGTEEWQAVVTGVASGDPEWIEVAEALLPGSDAGSTSELRDAVAWALARAPSQVLGLVARKQSDWALVCDGPPVDFPPEGPTAYFREAINAVSFVEEAELQLTKRDCLRQLRTAAKRAQS
jgi:predicted component of type VI protein secretion system